MRARALTCAYVHVSRPAPQSAEPCTGPRARPSPALVQEVRKGQGWRGGRSRRVDVNAERTVIEERESLIAAAPSEAESQRGSARFFFFFFFYHPSGCCCSFFFPGKFLKSKPAKTPPPKKQNKTTLIHLFKTQHKAFHPSGCSQQWLAHPLRLLA